MMGIALLLLALMFLVAGCQTSHVEPAECSIKDGWQVEDGGGAQSYGTVEGASLRESYARRRTVLYLH